MINTPSYLNGSVDKFTSDGQFKLYFNNLDYKMKIDLLTDIFSENDHNLSGIFEFRHDFSPSEQAFLILQKLPSDFIHENFKIIEDIFLETETKSNTPESQIIFNNIIALCFFKKKGLRISFLNADRIIYGSLPLNVKIDLAILLVYLDPYGLSFNMDIFRFPHLVPAKMILFEDKPFEVLKEFLSINEKPNEIIIRSIVKRPLKKCLENMMIKKDLIKEYVEVIEPLAKFHWSYDYFLENLSSSEFKKYFINQKIAEYKNFINIPSDDMLTKLYEELKTENIEVLSRKNFALEGNFQLLEIEIVRKNILQKAISEFEIDKNEIFASQYEYSLQNPANIILICVEYFRFFSIKFLKSLNYNLEWLPNSYVQLEEIYNKQIPRKKVTNSIEYIKSLDRKNLSKRFKEIVESI